MAKCCICSKGVVFGQNVSHSHRKTNRTWKPNIRKVKLEGSKAIYVCSRCLRTMKRLKPRANKGYGRHGVSALYFSKEGDRMK